MVFVSFGKNENPISSRHQEGRTTARIDSTSSFSLPFWNNTKIEAEEIEDRQTPVDYKVIRTSSFPLNSHYHSTSSSTSTS